MLKGSVVAMITPMDSKGAIDKLSLKTLIDYHVASGTTAIVALGTTGEASTIHHQERLDILMWVLEYSDNRIPIIVGTGSNSTSKAISLTKCFNHTGVIACLNVTPYYNRPNQNGLFQHFKAIAENSDLPQIIYNIPIRTGCDMLPSTISRLAEITNIIGIKEATGDLSRVSQLQALVSNDFMLFSGDDTTALDFMQLGGHGVISVTANIAAKEMTKLCQLAASGDFTEARRINYRLMPLHQSLLCEPNPIPVKWACKKIGLITSDTVRLPMTPMNDHKKLVVTKALTAAGFM